jgi:hypothetical protein
MKSLLLEVCICLPWLRGTVTGKELGGDRVGWLAARRLLLLLLLLLLPPRKKCTRRCLTVAPYVSQSVSQPSKKGARLGQQRLDGWLCTFSLSALRPNCFDLLKPTCLVYRISPRSVITVCT